MSTAHSSDTLTCQECGLTSFTFTQTFDYTESWDCSRVTTAPPVTKDAPRRYEVAKPDASWSEQGEVRQSTLTCKNCGHTIDTHEVRIVWPHHFEAQGGQT